MTNKTDGKFKFGQQRMKPPAQQSALPSKSEPDAQLAGHPVATPMSGSFSFAAARQEQMDQLAQGGSTDPLAPPAYLNDVPDFDDGAQYDPTDFEADAEFDHQTSHPEDFAFGNTKHRAGLIEPLGLNRSSGLVCGMMPTAFEGQDENVPPGSHYDAWVWNSMDKPGHLTIEIYADRRESDGDRITNTRSSNPVFDPSCHALVSIPQQGRMPWGDAQRVLLLPKTYVRTVEQEKSKSNNYGRPQKTIMGSSDKPSFGMSTNNSAATHTPPTSRVVWNDDIKGASAWMASERTHGVVFGSCEIEPGNGFSSREYWIVLPLAAAKLIHRQTYGDPGGESLDLEHNFGLKGVTRMQTQNSGTRKVSTPVPVESRRAVLPGQRYLGTWKGGGAETVTKKARERAGPALPSDWPVEDVIAVLNTHHGIAKMTERTNTPETIIEPLPYSPQKQRA